MRLISLIFIIFAALPSFADIVISGGNVTGASRVTDYNYQNPTGTLEVRGGFAGPKSGDPGFCNLDTNNTCNNCLECTAGDCTAAYANACNERRAYPELNLRFTFASTEKFGTPRLNTTNGTSTQPTNVTLSITSTPTTAVNQTITIGATWSSICSLFTADADIGGLSKANCDFKNANQNFQVGIDADNNGFLDGDDDILNFNIVVANPGDVADNVIGAAACTTGICNFSLGKGDEKAYIEDVGNITSAGRAIGSIIFLCLPDDGQGGNVFDQIGPKDVCARVPVTNNVLSVDNITGLTNGIRYYFHAAVEDDTGNVTNYLRRGNDQCPATAEDPAACRQVVPEEVIGLFKDKQNCFIATAAYGSSMDSHVKQLRRFRDRVLMNTTWGPAFVQAYYKISPTLAHWIAESPSRRAVVRGMLTPIVYSVSFMMTWSWLFAMAALFGCWIYIYRRKLN